MHLSSVLKFVRQILTGDEFPRYILAERIAGLIYKRYKFSEYGRLFLYDDDFVRLYERFENTGNFHSLDRKYALDQLTKLSLFLDGDTAECGAYKGASSYLICRRNLKYQKTHHIFDSFEGLSDPVNEDGDYWKKGDLSCGEHVLRENLKEFSAVHYYKGWIPERFSDVADRKFCFVHLDIDLYQPTRDSILFFYERMTPGGIILCDDYGFTSCPGANKAMNDFFSDKAEEIVLLPTGQGFVMKQA